MLGTKVTVKNLRNSEDELSEGAQRRQCSPGKLMYHALDDHRVQLDPATVMSGMARPRLGFARLFDGQTAANRVLGLNRQHDASANEWGSETCSGTRLVASAGEVRRHVPQPFGSGYQVIGQAKESGIALTDALDAAQGGAAAAVLELLFGVHVAVEKQSSDDLRRFTLLWQTWN